MGAKSLPLKKVIYDSLFASWMDPKVASLSFAISFVMLLYGVAWLLYRKKIFIKI